MTDDMNAQAQAQDEFWVKKNNIYSGWEEGKEFVYVNGKKFYFDTQEEAKLFHARLLLK